MFVTWVKRQREKIKEKTKVRRRTKTERKTKGKKELVYFISIDPDHRKRYRRNLNNYHPEKSRLRCVYIYI